MHLHRSELTNRHFGIVLPVTRARRITTPITEGGDRRLEATRRNKHIIPFPPKLQLPVPMRFLKLGGQRRSPIRAIGGFALNSS